MASDKYYGFITKKYNEYVQKFINLTSDNKTISPEFEIIANKYNKKRPNVLAMMLDYAITAGGPDIIDHLLDLGADPHKIPLDNNIHELVSDNDIDKKTIRKMVKVFAKHGFIVNLTD